MNILKICDVKNNISEIYKKIVFVIYLCDKGFVYRMYKSILKFGNMNKLCEIVKELIVIVKRCLIFLFFKDL